jgi:hypothetical protein
VSISDSAGLKLERDGSQRYMVHDAPNTTCEEIVAVIQKNI